MELELKKEALETYEVGGEYTLAQEETTETIVPDYSPDIARIIETEGKVFLHSRELRDGKAEISGTVRVSVLYTSDEENGIRVLEFSMPFTAQSEQLSKCTYVSADTDIEFLETRMLNPRKVFTHCKLVTHLTGYQKLTLGFSSDIEAEDSLQVEKKKEQQHTTLLTQIAEKDFTFSEEFNLSAGKEGAAELLSNQVSGNVTETKIVGNKLIFRGIFSVCILYRSRDGQCCSACEELPFSQIMEIESAQENAGISMQLQLTGIDLQIDGADDEGRQMALTLYAHTLALVREERDVSLLSDLYSTAYDVSVDAVPVSFNNFCERMTRRQSVREVLEIGMVAESVLSVHVSCSCVNVTREGENITLRTSAAVRALYLDEGGSCLVAERCVDVACQVDLPADCTVTARAICPEAVQATLGERGIEVRFPVDFRIEAVSRAKKVCICGVKLDQDTPKDTADAPSLVLRYLGAQESLWDLAKKYNATIDSILTANQVENEGDISPENLLLIPRKRA